METLTFKKEIRSVFFVFLSQLFHRYGRWVLPGALVFPSSTTNRRFLKISGFVCLRCIVSFL